MGYTGEEMHVHGFRAMARTMIRQEMNLDPEWIERQLSHAVNGPLGRAYDRTTHLPERKKMMQAWADYLDRLAVGKENKVVPIRAEVRAERG
jgi:integrase